MDDGTQIPNLIAIAAAAASMFLLGGLWYSPLLFAKAWQCAAALSDADLAARKLPVVFGLSAFVAVVAATTLAFFIGADAGVAFGAAAGAAAGVAWVAAGMAITYLFERRPLALWLIDAGYHAVAFTIMGAILGAWG